MEYDMRLTQLVWREGFVEEEWTYIGNERPAKRPRLDEDDNADPKRSRLDESTAGKHQQAPTPSGEVENAGAK